MAASGAGDGRSSTAQVRRCSLGHTPPHKPLTCRTDQPCLSVGGRQTKDAYRVLKQLESTEINCAIRYRVKKLDGSWEEHWRSGSFRIIVTLSFEGDERGRFARTAFQLHDVIVQNFKNRHVSYFNWERMRGLSMVGMMLYKRFFRHWANIYRDGMEPDELIFDKN